MVPQASRSPNPAIRERVPEALTVEPAPRTTSSPARRARLPAVTLTVTPGLTVRSSAQTGKSLISPAVYVALPADVVLTAMVSGLLAEMVVVVPVFEEVLTPSTALMVNAPVLAMSTAPPVLLKARVDTAVSRLTPAAV